MREEETKKFIVDELRKYFHVMNEQEILESIRNYKSVLDKDERAIRMKNRDPPPTDYNKEIIEKFGTRAKAIKAITKTIQNDVKKRFGIRVEKPIEETRFSIDLFDEEEKICYEICLGDGAEIFKDVLKALLVGAKKLVVFCRSYPNPWGMIGYGYAARQWGMLKKRIQLEVEIIEFISEARA